MSDRLYRQARLLLVAACVVAGAAGAADAPSAALPAAQDDTAQSLLVGGDVSALTLEEKHGARYRDRDGRRGDALQILKDSGARIVRLRLYEAPGRGHGREGYYWPEDSMNLPDLLGLARRAAALGLQIELTFHYSDFWTDHAHQDLPHAWSAQLAELPDDAARMQRLRELVYQRTRVVMLALQAQGTTPQFVSIGNEIEGGILYPYGAATEANWPRLAQLLRAGAEAVKSVSPSSRVILHLDDAGNDAKYIAYFDHATQLGVPWDVIGMSYYPFWSRRTVAQVVAFSNRMAARYGRDMMVMETGFNWHPTRADGYPGQLTDNGPYPAAMSTPQGQRDFMSELLAGLRSVDHGHMIGVLYWDPIMIATPGVGWAVREDDDSAAENMVSNTTLFDFNGRALPVLDVLREPASSSSHSSGKP